MIMVVMMIMMIVVVMVMVVMVVGMIVIVGMIMIMTMLRFSRFPEGHRFGGLSAAADVTHVALPLCSNQVQKMFNPR